MVALGGFKGYWAIDIFRFILLFSSIIPIRYSSHSPVHTRLSRSLTSTVFALTWIWERPYVVTGLAKIKKLKAQSRVPAQFQSKYALRLWQSKAIASHLAAGQNQLLALG